MRHKPWALPEMKQDEKFFLNPTNRKGAWQAEFGNGNPIDLEIGCGKGDFIRELARRNPDRNYLALDLKNDVLVYTLRKINEEGLENIRVISMKAEDLDEVFDRGEISRIYINFANPWPKASHNKRRLTHPRFLSLYRLFLTAEGQIEFKTDDEGLYIDSLEYFPLAGYEITYQSDDLPKDHPGNIQTEYETKFRTFGMPIYRIDANLGEISGEKLEELLEYKRKAAQRVGRPGWEKYQNGEESAPSDNG